MADEPEITEFEKMEAERLDAVGSPANGTPFLLMKSLAGSDGDAAAAPSDDDDDDDDDDDTPDGAAAKSYVFCGDDACTVCAGRLAKAKLKAKERNALPGSDFVFPKQRRYPIHDKSHARNALSRSSGKPEQSKVRAAVSSRYPGIGKKAASTTESVSQTRPTHEERMGPKSMNNKRKGNDIDPASKVDLATSLPNPGTSNPRGGGDLTPGGSLEQTRGRARKESESAGAEGHGPNEIDMRGDPTPGAPRDGVHRAGARMDEVARTKSASQTKKRKRKAVVKNTAPAMAKSDPALVEAAGKLTQRANELAIELAQRGRQEGEAYKSWPHPTALQSEEALGRARALLEGLVVNLRLPYAAKELDDMTGTELGEFLDARDARMKADRKARKAAKAKKAAKTKKIKSAKAKKAARTAAEPLVDTEAIARAAAQATETAVKAAVEPLKERVDKMAAEKASPRPRPALNNRADPNAVLRDQAESAAKSETTGEGTGDAVPSGNALKALEERFEKATDPYERQKLGMELTTAKITIAERQRFSR